MSGVGNMPPDWSIERALSMADTGTKLDDVKRHWPGHATALAFARYIAEHEEAPVDLLLIEAREIVAQWWERNPGRFNVFTPEGFRAGEYDSDPTVEQAFAALRRGIEIAKGGES